MLSWIPLAIPLAVVAVLGPAVGPRCWQVWSGVHAELWTPSSTARPLQSRRSGLSAAAAATASANSSAPSSGANSPAGGAF